eukprot:scaffold3240_cov187-Amphora_coffeaeformis.AAC.11
MTSVHGRHAKGCQIDDPLVSVSDGYLMFGYSYNTGIVFHKVLSMGMGIGLVLKIFGPRGYVSGESIFGWNRF